jgi:taurine dioxygenase
VITLTPVAGALGAEVSGLDLCGPLTQAQYEALNTALLEHQVLFFRDQAISPAQHAALAALFGTPQLHQAYPHIEGYPQLTILENDKDRPSKIEKWHTDMTFRAKPPLGSILHGVIIPSRGGDTLFASMSACYEGLSDKLQHFLDGLSAIHDFQVGFKESLEAPGGRERLASMVRDNPPVAHPVVRTHPLSGRKGLFINSLFTSSIEGMKERESRALLAFLCTHMESPEYSCRMHWQPDSIAFWDNRITQHRPINDYWPQHRRMQRITIDGDRPVF